MYDFSTALPPTCCSGKRNLQVFSFKEEHLPIKGTIFSILQELCVLDDDTFIYSTFYPPLHHHTEARCLILFMLAAKTDE